MAVPRRYLAAALARGEGRKVGGPQRHLFRPVTVKSRLRSIFGECVALRLRRTRGAARSASESPSATTGNRDDPGTAPLKNLGPGA